jgi:cardiolipin synthase (CMP-forming)
MRDVKHISKKILTLPNIVTFGRILCVPLVVLFLWHKAYSKALVFFSIAALSDALDGFLARYMKARSEWGAYLDPLADKLLFVCTFLTLGYFNIIPFWLIILSIYRDVIIMLGVGFLSLRKVPVEIKPLFISKANTFVQSIVVVMFLIIKAFSLTHPWLGIAQAFVIINVITLFFSGMGYVLKGLETIEIHSVAYAALTIFIILFVVLMQYMIEDVCVWGAQLLALLNFSSSESV